MLANQLELTWKTSARVRSFKFIKKLLLILYKLQKLHQLALNLTICQLCSTPPRIQTLTIWLELMLTAIRLELVMMVSIKEFFLNNIAKYYSYLQCQFTARTPELLCKYEQTNHSTDVSTLWEDQRLATLMSSTPMLSDWILQWVDKIVTLLLPLESTQTQLFSNTTMLSWPKLIKFTR